MADVISVIASMMSGGTCLVCMCWIKVVMLLDRALAMSGCETNPIGLPAADWRKIVNDCPWPTRLDNLFNQVLFDGKHVVRVTWHSRRFFIQNRNSGS